MGKIVQTIQNDFSGGILEDKRAGWVGSGGVFSTRHFSLTKHFDVFSYPKKLFPYHKTEADENKTLSIVKFIYAPYDSGSDYRLYGFAVYSTNLGIAYVHADLPSTGWTDPTSVAVGNVARSTRVFFNSSFIFSADKVRMKDMNR